MNLTLSREADVAIARLDDDRLDAAIAIQFKDRFKEQIGDWQGPVVLDLSAVTFLDSSGLGALVSVMKILGQKDRLRLAGLQPVVEKVLRLTRMDKVFAIYDSVADALSSVEGGQAA